MVIVAAVIICVLVFIIIMILCKSKFKWDLCDAKILALGKICFLNIFIHTLGHRRSSLNDEECHALIEKKRKVKLKSNTYVYMI